MLGVGLIALFLSATAWLDNQRIEAVSLFSEARAAMTSDRLELLPLAEHSFAHGNEQQEPLATTAPALIVEENKPLPVAVLRMASVGLEVPVYADISELNLSRGAGWIEGTAAPNTGGNMAIAAHRDRFFRPLKDVEVGDLLELESLTGSGEFRVSRISIVDPDDVSVLDDTAVPTVTMVTCYPFYFIGNAPQRYIVQAIAVGTPRIESTTYSIPIDPPSGETP